MLQPVKDAVLASQPITDATDYKTDWTPAAVDPPGADPAEADYEAHAAAL